MRMTFICEHDGPFNHVTNRITHETMNETWPEILEDFEMFLRGCGFHFNGSLDVVDPNAHPDDGFDFLVERHENNAN